MSSPAQPILNIRDWLALKAQQAQTGNLRDLFGLRNLPLPTAQSQPDPYHDQQVRQALASFGAKPVDESGPKSVFALKKGK